MDQDSGRFVPLTEYLKEGEKVMATCIAAVVKNNPQGQSPEVKPTLGIGEVVTIKGVMFRVLKMKEDGRLTLKMLNRAEVEESRKP